MKVIKTMDNIDYILQQLKKSKFRSKFCLSEQDKKYISEKGLNTIKTHAYNFVNLKLAPDFIPNDGKQTAYKGHPVFVAQHATATCCRTCLEKWHKIKKGKKLSNEEQDYIVTLIMSWIENNI